MDNTKNKVIITVVGKDTVGIIAKVCTYLSEGSVNVLDNIRVAKMARAKVFMDLSCIALIASRLSDAASKEKTTKIVQIYHSKNSYEKSAI